MTQGIHKSGRNCRICDWLRPHVQRKYLDIPRYCDCPQSDHYGHGISPRHPGCAQFHGLPGSVESKIRRKGKQR